jgi:hypothetical protein
MSDKSNNPATAGVVMMAIVGSILWAAAEFGAWLWEMAQ